MHAIAGERLAMSDDITEKVLDVIAASKRMPREKVTATSTFEELGMDSLSGLNLIFDIESAFDVSVPDEVLERVKSVPQLIENLKLLLAQKAAPPGSPQ